MSRAGEADSLLPHLLQFTSEHRAEGKLLQEDIDLYEGELREAIDEIWKKPGKEDPPASTDTWATRMEEREKEQLIDAIEKVAKPEVDARDCHVVLYDLEK